MSTIVSNTTDIQGKRGRKESLVWEHFIKESLGSGHYSAKCYYCNHSWIRGKPEVLKSHLALYCTEVPLSIKTEYMEMIAVGSTASNRRQNTNANSLTEVDVVKKDKIDQALIRFFVCCGIPFSTVNHPYFVDFIQSLCFGYNPPKKDALSTTILNKEITLVMKNIQDELKYEENLTLGNIFRI
jgi:hypothetical protein